MKIIRKIECQSRLIFYSPNGKQLAITMTNTAYNIYIYDFETSIFFPDILVNSYFVHDISWNFNGNILACATNNTDDFLNTSFCIKLWNIKTNTLTFTIDLLNYMENITLHTLKDTMIVWSPIGDQLLYNNVTRNNDNVQRQMLMMFDNLKQISDIICYITVGESICSMSFSTNGEDIVFLTSLGIINIYNLIQKKLYVQINLNISNVDNINSNNGMKYYCNHHVVNILWSSISNKNLPILLELDNVTIDTNNNFSFIEINKINKMSIIIRNFRSTSINFNKNKIAYHQYGKIVIYDIIDNIILHIFKIARFHSFCWSPIDDSIAISTSTGIQIWKKVFNYDMKMQIHNNDFILQPKNVVFHKNIDISRFNQTQNI
jgi:hypothetical protein